MTRITPSPDLIGRDPGSITCLLGPLREGDDDAARKLWDRFFARLVALAGSRLGPIRTLPVDPEDIALQAFAHFCRLMERPDVEERLPEMANRENVWRVLARITTWEALDHLSPPTRPVVGGDEGLDQVPAHGPELPMTDGFTEEVVKLLDQLRGRNAAQTERLRRLALLKMDGKTNKEAALELGCGVTLVEWLLRAIRRIWEEHDPRPLSARRSAPRAGA